MQQFIRECEKMKRIMLFILFVLGLFMLAGCSGEKEKETLDGITSATASRYREYEIREYEGVRLDPAIGPRDNSIKGIQNVNIDKYRLKITGLVDKSIDLEYKDVLKLDDYKRKITLYCVEGWDATILWEGVLLKDILDLAGIDQEANTVIFHSVDG